MKDGPKYRILHLIDNMGMGGAQMFLLNLLSRWPDERDEIHVAALGSRKELLGAFQKLDRVSTHACSGSFPQPANIAIAARLMSGASFDIVHCHLSRSAVAALLCPLGRRPSLILHGHSELAVCSPYYHAFMRSRAKRVDRIFANAPNVADSFARYIRFPRERIEVVPNGIMLDSFEQSGARREAFRKELGIAPGIPVAGFVGRLSESKGVEYLLDAFPAIRAAHPEALLLIVGDGPLRASLEERAAALNLSESIRFVGFQTDTPLWLSAFDVAVGPSRWETFGISAIEAMAAGVPFVGADLGGFHENIEHGKTGYLVPAKDAGALGACVADVLANRKGAALVAANARAYVRERYAIERIAGRIRELYGEICGARNAVSTGNAPGQ